MALHVLETVTDRLVLWDLENLIRIRENPKIAMFFTGAGILIVAKLVTLSVISPLTNVCIFFAVLMAIPVGYLIWGLANSLDSVKDAFGSYANIDSKQKESSIPMHPMAILMLFNKVTGIGS